MAMNRFVEALKGPPKVKYEGADVFPGTRKVRTFFTNSPNLYSEESNIKTVIANRERVFKSEEKK